MSPAAPPLSCLRGASTRKVRSMLLLDTYGNVEIKVGYDRRDQMKRRWREIDHEEIAGFPGSRTLDGPPHRKRDGITTFPRDRLSAQEHRIPL